jgi:hypothetical protein
VLYRFIEANAVMVMSKMKEAVLDAVLLIAAKR